MLAKNIMSREDIEAENVKVVERLQKGHKNF